MRLNSPTPPRPDGPVARKRRTRTRSILFSSVSKAGSLDLEWLSQHSIELAVVVSSAQSVMSKSPNNCARSEPLPYHRQEGRRQTCGLVNGDYELDAFFLKNSFAVTLDLISSRQTKAKRYMSLTGLSPA